MKKILIVEDDQNIAKALAIRLKSAGYEVTVAPDAVTAVAAALQIQPDLALLDISLPMGNGSTFADKVQEVVGDAEGYFTTPGDHAMLLAAIRRALSENDVSGFAVADKIQELVATATPIIFLTASKLSGLRRRAQDLGAVGFFEKPYHADELLAAIKRALSENEVSKP